ncbi:gamma-aminobutyric acid receptor subunit pi-like isoform X1 [Panonychus citri]|uniref:gamma-aminobutyric acid receptor subunit pi-like isoform X1 n=1 Tax=Panonychus citri TaxID=50023 RepID=UPI002308139E|nr:gamma-aminobutyric acid receptor subunit pi-like isoform X1 [Panonychus citri]
MIRVKQLSLLSIIYWLLNQSIGSESLPVPLTLSPNPDQPLALYNQIKIESISSLDTTQATFDVDLFLIQNWYLNESVCLHYTKLHDNYQFRAPLIANDDDLTIIESDLLSQIWLPRTHISQVKTPINPSSSYFTDGFITIYPKSQVNQCMIKFLKRILIKVECDLDFRRYPRDTQNCPIDFTSAFWSMSTLNYFWTENPIDINPINLEQNDYSISLTTSSKIATSYDGQNRTWLTLQFTFRRKLGHFILEIIIPSIFIIISAFFSFFIAIETGSGRFAFSARPLFNLIVLYSSYKTYLPPLSYVNAGDVWMLANLFFGFIAMSGVVFCVHLWQKQEIKPTNLGNSSQSTLIVSNLTHPPINGIANRRRTQLARSFTIDGFVNNNNLIKCNCHRCRKIFILKYFHFSKCLINPNQISLMTRAKYDNLMKIVYPISFITFNIFYWIYLLNSDQ